MGDLGYGRVSILSGRGTRGLGFENVDSPR